MDLMDFKIYLVSNRLTVRAFSKMLRCHPNYLSQILGGKVPGKKVAQDIERLTNGKIKASDLRPEKIKATEAN